MIGLTYAGGKGTVKCCSVRGKKGLRNKRKAYWSGIRMAIIKERMKLRKLERQKRYDESGDIGN